KIEELLKAYAKKRRDEAGASFELTAPTRRLLQAEAARQWSKAAPESASPSFFQLLVRFWPQITLAVSGVLLVGIVVRMLSGPDRHSIQVAFDQRPAASPAAAPQKTELSKDSPGLKSQDAARVRQPAEAKKLDSGFA